MAQISKAITENTVRTATFAALNIPENAQFVRISNQSYGAVFTDDNGAHGRTSRYRPQGRRGTVRF